MRPNHLITACAVIGAISAIAGPVTHRWTVETSKPAATVCDAFQGETIYLEPTLLSYGAAASVSNSTLTLFYQTNGMASAWWSKPADADHSVTGRIRAIFAPTNDIGAAQYTFFIQATDTNASNYRAYGLIRMRSSPGYRPSAAPAPASQWVTSADMQAVSNALASAIQSLSSASELAIANEAAIRAEADAALLTSNALARAATTNLAWIHDYDFATLKSGLDLAFTNVIDEAAIRAAADTALLSSNTLARIAITNEAAIRASIDTAISNQVVNLPRVPTNAVTGWLLYDSGSNKWLRVTVSNYSYYISEVL
jgi:hypothetical protein